MALTYLDFELEIGPVIDGAYSIAVLKSPAGEIRTTLRWPFSALQLENRLKDLQIALLSSGGVRRQVLSPAEQAVQTFGRELFDWLFTGEVRNRYDVSQERARQQRKGLRVKLRIQPPALAALPWEYLYDERAAEYLCLSRSTPLVRYLELPQPIQPLAVMAPLQVLGMIASTTDLQPLDVALEKQRIERAIADLQAQGLLQWTWLAGQTVRDLQRALRRGPWHIFHFIGHGRYDALRAEGQIALADAVGKTHLFGATDLARLLGDHQELWLVLLNSCEGAQGRRDDIFAGTAATLMRRGLPAVVAMQYAITDGAAIEFAQTFYESLADALPVDAAVGEARKAISVNIPNSLEWGAPVLHLRAPEGQLFAIDALPKKHENLLEVLREPIQPVFAWPEDPTQTLYPVLSPFATKKEKVFTVAGIGFTFVHVSEGPFTMGSDNSYDYEKPEHIVTLNAFWIMKNSVTNEQYNLFIKDRGYSKQEFWTEEGWQWCEKNKLTEPLNWQDTKRDRSRFPMVEITWYEATAFAKWLASATGQAIRLPTEPEWEKAARGPFGSKYPWGNDSLPRNPLRQNMWDLPLYGYEVPDNLYGVQGMFDGLTEWTSSLWGKEWEVPDYRYPYHADDGPEDIDAPTDVLRVLRGGIYVLRIPVSYSTRFRLYPGDRMVNLPSQVGFRLVLSSPR